MAAADIRVYAGGIGGSVGEDDIRKTFAKFGEIARVEIVRTKGRGFAYFDLVPSKPNSFHNLLSIYNGCAWKGGKLRLEKAREHYLARLRREWADDSELRAAPIESNDAEKSTAVQDRSKKFVDSEKQLCVYFPKLRKVKSLPFRGTGKHKYSFQRVDVPPMPKHFCDCDEHTDSTQSLKMEQPHEDDILCGGIEAEELNLMKSVMNKLFKDEKYLESTQNGAVVLEEDVSPEDATPFIEDSNGSLVDDDDDLVINITSYKGNTKAMSQPSEVSTRKTSKTRDAPTVKSIQILTDGQNVNAISSKKRRMSLISAEDLFKKPSAANRGELAGHSNTVVVEDDDNLVINVVPGAGKPKAITHLSDFIVPEKPDTSTKDVPKNQTSKKKRKSLNSVEALPEESSVASKDELTLCSNVPGGNSISVSTGSSLELNRPRAQPLWSRKSPWKALIGSGDDKSFSISNILPSHDLGNDQHLGPDNSKESTAIFAENPTVGPPAGMDDESIEPQTLPNDGFEKQKSDPSFSKSGRGSFWRHDSSWTQLVNSRDTSFSVSHVLPVSGCEGNVLLADMAADKSGSIELGNRPVKEGSDWPLSGEERKQKPVRSSGVAAQVEDKKTRDGNNTASCRETSMPSDAETTFAVTEEGRHRASHALMIDPDEPCPFMRSEASLRDWANTKAALTGSRKRKK
ncbi:hypothetical protein MLD38_014149 [Melastoma candidum]|uniref:Uncharacterized protein n=1 Tax=Melastoma candidum TaxID=119954 RepID=A0ACB9RBS7_9MYRT|nr:hypothetical protein MLD38_014149 [Melastoma candidum]